MLRMTTLRLRMVDDDPDDAAEDGNVKAAKHLVAILKIMLHHWRQIKKCTALLLLARKKVPYLTFISIFTFLAS